ncbi:conserved exported hypothetical protein [uncultured Desulfobacterium sp.]|uniref:Murein endopeptidase K n=1 Tax=uncultured Desulfobacterium sp. TaxID=201089 RepID=A0A445MSE0_9BACT|nr:conserved exported hypothetical protein [uncultured Desulfobacterium sp.]
MKRIAQLIVLAALLSPSFISAAEVEASLHDISRFFHTGDGCINLISEKNGESFKGRYRFGLAQYDMEAMDAIHRVFDIPKGRSFPGLSLRLIEFLDFLEDRLRPGSRIVIISGYRDPQYNSRLRNKGGLAAEASLHQYGMAADLKMDKVTSRRIWDYVKDLGFGGAGYYHDQSVHVDVGPARSWDEKTTGVGTGISSSNKLIGIVTDYDVYTTGETITLMFIRMTAFPIGVKPEFSLELLTDSGGYAKVVDFRPSFSATLEGACPEFSDIGQMGSIHWRLPEQLAAGRYRVRAGFCNRIWEEMPPEVATPEFEIVRPREK